MLQIVTRFNYFFFPCFCSKIWNWSPILSLNLVLIFEKIIQFGSFLANQWFFTKIDNRITLITLTKQITLINIFNLDEGFNFDEKSFICVKKFNKKDQITSIFSKIWTKVRVRKIRGSTKHFWTETETKSN